LTLRTSACVSTAQYPRPPGDQAVAGSSCQQTGSLARMLASTSSRSGRYQKAGSDKRADPTALLGSAPCPSPPSLSPTRCLPIPRMKDYNLRTIQTLQEPAFWVDGSLGGTDEQARGC